MIAFPTSGWLYQAGMTPRQGPRGCYATRRPSERKVAEVCGKSRARRQYVGPGTWTRASVKPDRKLLPGVGHDQHAGEGPDARQKLACVRASGKQVRLTMGCV